MFVYAWQWFQHLLLTTKYALQQYKRNTVAFPWQQWIRGCATILRYTCICLYCSFNVFNSPLLCTNECLLQNNVFLLGITTTRNCTAQGTLNGPVLQNDNYLQYATSRKAQVSHSFCFITKFLLLFQNTKFRLSFLVKYI